MRILINVDDLGPLGGVEQHVFHMAEELARRHHHIDLLYRRPAGYEDEARAFCASVTPVPSFDAKLRHPLRDGRRIWPAIRAGARCHPDVVYANRFSQLSWAIPTALISRSAVVCHLHFFQEHKITRLRSAPVHRFVAVSHALAEQWEGAGIDRERISVVPNGVDLERFPVGGAPERERARQSLGIPEDAFVALYCGRIDTEKGVDVLLEAWSLLPQPPGGARLLLLGSAGSSQDAAAYYRELLERAVKGCDWLGTRSDVVVPMHAADVVVVPSRSESFGRVIVEAMATGRPVVASEVGGIPEILDGPFSRFLVPQDSPKELAAALEGLFGWQQREPGLAAACSAHVRDRFNLSRSVGLLELVLEEAPWSPMSGADDVVASDVVRAFARRAKRAAMPFVRRLPLQAETWARRLGRLVLPSGVVGEPPSGATDGPGDGPLPGAPRAGHRMARHGRAPTVILMYHRIAEDADDPFRLAVRPERFAAQMAKLPAFGEPVPLREVTRPSRRPRIAVTLDDGYADNFSAGLEALSAAGVPATIFATSALVGSEVSLWPLRLEELFRLGRSRTGRVCLELEGNAFEVELGSGPDRTIAMHRLHEELRARPPAQIAAALAQLEAQLEQVPPDPGRRMLTAEELRGLAASGLVTIGATTRRHPWLASLTGAEQEEEIAGSRADLEALLGLTVEEFAYPFGTRRSFDGRSVRAVRRAGFALACTTLPDAQVAGTSRFRLPRRHVLDWELPEFASRLQQWLAA